MHLVGIQFFIYMLIPNFHDPLTVKTAPMC